MSVGDSSRCYSVIPLFRIPCFTDSLAAHEILSLTAPQCCLIYYFVSMESPTQVLSHAYPCFQSPARLISPAFVTCSTCCLYPWIFVRVLLLSLLCFFLVMVHGAIVVRLLGWVWVSLHLGGSMAMFLCSTLACMHGSTTWVRVQSSPSCAPQSRNVCQPTPRTQVPPMEAIAP